MFDIELGKLFQRFIFTPKHRFNVEVHLFKRDSIIQGRLEDIIVKKVQNNPVGAIKEIKISGVIIPIENIRYIKRLLPIAPQMPDPPRTIKSRLPSGFVYEISTRRTPVTLALFGKEYLTALFKGYTLYAFALLDKDGYPYIVFKHAVKALINAYDKPRLFGKYISFEEAPLQLKRVKRREWQFTEHLKGEKLYKDFLKKNVMLKLREGMNIWGKLIGLEEYDLLLKCGTSKVLIMRHALLSVTETQKVHYKIREKLGISI